MISKEIVERALGAEYTYVTSQLKDEQEKPVSLDLMTGMIQSATRLGLEIRIEALETIAAQIELDSGQPLRIGRETEDPIPSETTREKS